MYLVDTNVLSVGSSVRQGDAALIDWLDAHSDELFLSTITVAEIVNGIARLRRSGSLIRATRLDDWLDVVLHFYGDRVMPFDVAAARLAGLLMDRARATGLDLPTLPSRRRPAFTTLRFSPGTCAISHHWTFLR